MLHIRIQHPHSEMPAAVSHEVKRALQHALDCFEHMVREVHVTLRDQNGPKGGEDKQCTLHVSLIPRGLAVVRARASTFQGAVNIACDKLQQIVAKQIGRRKQKRSRRSTDALRSAPEIEDIRELAS